MNILYVYNYVRDFILFYLSNLLSVHDSRVLYHCHVNITYKNFIYSLEFITFLFDNDTMVD